MAVYRVEVIDGKGLIRIRAFGDFTVQSLMAICEKIHAVSPMDCSIMLFDLRGCLMRLTCSEFIECTLRFLQTVRMNGKLGMNAILMDATNDYTGADAVSQDCWIQFFSREVDALKWLEIK